MGGSALSPIHFLKSSLKDYFPMIFLIFPTALMERWFWVTIVTNLLSKMLGRYIIVWLSAKIHDVWKKIMPSSHPNTCHLQNTILLNYSTRIAIPRSTYWTTGISSLIAPAVQLFSTYCNTTHLSFVWRYESIAIGTSIVNILTVCGRYESYRCINKYMFNQSVQLGE